MSTFKAQLQKDAQDIFLNCEEFAEMVNIDGVEMPVIWGEESETGDEFYSAAVQSFGLNVETLTIYVLEGAMARPLPEQNLWIDGECWRVARVLPETGMLKLQLYRNTA